MHKYKPIQFDDLADVLHNANVRRSADFGLWLRQYLADRRQAGLNKHAKALMNTIVSSVAPSRRRAV